MEVTIETFDRYVFVCYGTLGLPSGTFEMK
jgi:hypothetical protein